MGFWLLLTPFVTGIWLNESWGLGQTVLTLILIDFYFKGGRIVLINFKIAAGSFERDKDLTLIQGGINLVLSVAGVRYIGLAGIYVGTVVSGILANLIQPFIIYHDCFSQNVWTYFADSFKYIGTILGVVLVMLPVRHFLLAEVNLLTFILMALVVTVVYNLVFLLIFGRTQEFGYLRTLLMRRRKKGV